MTPFKHVAALSSSLLARKGNAMPASLGGLPPHPLMPQRLDGWLPPPFPPEPMPPRRPARPVSEIPVTEIPVTEIPPARAASNPPSHNRGVKVSLRLDEDRHLKLRLAAAHQHRSGQEILLAALDAYLKTCAATAMDGNCACLKRPSGS
jgi:hypothetical protein